MDRSTVNEILPFDDASVARYALMNLADNDSIRGANNAVPAVTATSVEFCRAEQDKIPSAVHRCTD